MDPVIHEHEIRDALLRERGANRLGPLGRLVVAAVSGGLVVSFVGHDKDTTSDQLHQPVVVGATRPSVISRPLGTSQRALTFLNSRKHEAHVVEAALSGKTAKTYDNWLGKQLTASSTYLDVLAFRDGVEAFVVDKDGATRAISVPASVVAVDSNPDVSYVEGTISYASSECGYLATFASSQDGESWADACDTRDT